MQDSYRRCRSYIECQLREAGPLPSAPRPFVTISRQSGSGGYAVASRLSQILRARICETRCGCPWTVFGRELVQRVIDEHHLSEHNASYLGEDVLSEIEDTMDDLFGLHPSKWTLVHKMSQTILRLARTGEVILVGRAANVVTRSLPGGFHVRLVGSPDKRLERLKAQHGLDDRRARERMRREDRDRGAYLKKYFNRDINDPLAYHLVVNTDGFDPDAVADLVSHPVLQAFRLGHERAPEGRRV